MSSDVCLLLLSDSGIGVNGETAAGEHDGAEATPDRLVVQCEAGVLRAETVGCRHVDMCIAGVGVFFMDSLEKKLKEWSATSTAVMMVWLGY